MNPELAHEVARLIGSLSTLCDLCAVGVTVWLVGASVALIAHGFRWVYERL